MPPPCRQQLPHRSHHQLRSRKQQQHQRLLQKKIVREDSDLSPINTRENKVSGQDRNVSSIIATKDHQNNDMSSEPSNALVKSNKCIDKSDDTSRVIISPFSTNARKIMTRPLCDETNTTSETISFGLLNCRRVSLLLKVIPHPQTISGNKEGLVKDGGDEVDEDGYGPILFPALMGSDGDDDATAGATAASKQSKLRQGEVILVNPHAFDAKEKEENDCGEGPCSRLIVTQV